MSPNASASISTSRRSSPRSTTSTTAPTAKTAADLFLDISGGKPKFEFRNPTGCGLHAGRLRGSAELLPRMDDGAHRGQRRRLNSPMRLDADIELGDGWVDALRVGVRRAERDQNVNWSTYNWGSVQPLWGVQTDEAYLPQRRVSGRARYQARRPRARTWSAAVYSAVARSSTRAFADRRATTRRASTCTARPQQQLGSAGAAHRLRGGSGQPGGLYCPVEQQQRDRRRRRRLHHVQVRRRRHQDRQRQRHAATSACATSRPSVGAIGGMQFPTGRRPRIRRSPGSRFRRIRTSDAGGRHRVHERRPRRRRRVAPSTTTGCRA